MSLSEKEKRRVIAITRQLKEQKGIGVDPKEINADIKIYRDKLAGLDAVKKEYSDLPAIVEEAEQEQKKLQSIINDLNEYMEVLHPEGLLDFGSGSKGTKTMGAG